MSGEILSGPDPFGIHLPTVETLAEELVEAHSLSVRMALVVGGGNIFRGVASGTARGIDRATSDYMGMLATCINALALQSAIEKKGVQTRVQTALPIASVAESYIRRKALRHLKKERIVIFSAGTGNPYFTTDTSAALRAMEMEADILLKATKVDGVYDQDPEKNKDAKKYDQLNYNEVLSKEIKVMDATAITLCKDNKMPLIVFNVKEKGNIIRLLKGEKLGTFIQN